VHVKVACVWRRPPGGRKKKKEEEEGEEGGRGRRLEQGVTRVGGVSDNPSDPLQ